MIDSEELKKYTINLEELWVVLIEHGQRDKQFKLGEIIKYDPSAVIEIAKHYLDTGEW